MRKHRHIGRLIATYDWGKENWGPLSIERIKSVRYLF
jgi:hypothetical protein